METKISKKVVKSYLKAKFKKRVELLEYKKLGRGWHGSSYKVRFKIGIKPYTVILRTKNKLNFSHDYKSDRAASFILNHQLANILPKHVKSLDVVGIQRDDNIVSLGSCDEFFQVVAPADGKEYMEDLGKIMNKGYIKEDDKIKALLLSNYLVELHKNKFKGNKQIAASIYKRHLRDCIGSGEMLIGVIDSYPKKIDFLKRNEATCIIKKSVELREKIKGNHQRLCKIHGDFHPANVLFRNKKDFMVLDASRELYGDPADDITCMAINYIWFSIIHKGNFSGPFKELFEIFWNNYIKKTKDKEINKIAPIFFAFRGVVVAHPLFYKNQTNATRRKIFNFIDNVLDEEKFNYKRINSYLKK